MAGWSVASAGDVNGDSVGDIVIGAFSADPGGVDRAGRSYVVFDTTGGFCASVNLAALADGTGGFVINGHVIGDVTSCFVAAAGDFNGDGFGDVVIGAAEAAAFDGHSSVVFGAAGGLPAVISLATIAAGVGGFAIAGQAAGDRSGSSVSNAGDVNGDGIGDLLIGARFADPPTGGNTERTDVLFGSTAPSAAAVSLTIGAAGSGGFVINSQNTGDLSGQSVTVVGDLNGDGIDKVLIGVPFSATAAGA